MTVSVPTGYTIDDINIDSYGNTNASITCSVNGDVISISGNSGSKFSDRSTTVHCTLSWSSDGYTPAQGKQFSFTVESSKISISAPTVTYTEAGNEFTVATSTSVTGGEYLVEINSGSGTYYRTVNGTNVASVNVDVSGGKATVTSSNSTSYAIDYDVTCSTTISWSFTVDGVDSSYASGTFNSYFVRTVSKLSTAGLGPTLSSLSDTTSTDWNTLGTHSNTISNSDANSNYTLGELSSVSAGSNVYGIGASSSGMEVTVTHNGTSKNDTDSDQTVDIAGEVSWSLANTDATGSESWSWTHTIPKRPQTPDVDVPTISDISAIGSGSFSISLEDGYEITDWSVAENSHSEVTATKDTSTAYKVNYAGHNETYDDVSDKITGTVDWSKDGREVTGLTWETNSFTVSGVDITDPGISISSDVPTSGYTSYYSEADYTLSVTPDSDDTYFNIDITSVQATNGLDVGYGTVDGVKKVFLNGVWNETSNTSSTITVQYNWSYNSVNAAASGSGSDTYSWGIGAFPTDDFVLSGGSNTHRSSWQAGYTSMTETFNIIVPSGLSLIHI